jgi:hypothetical protein
LRVGAARALRMMIRQLDGIPDYYNGRK